MFDRILVFLLVVCGIIFLRLTLGEVNQKTTPLVITDTSNNTILQNNTNTSTQTAAGNELERALSWAKNVGITSFSTLESFRPNDDITRGEFAKMLTTYIASTNALITNGRNEKCLFHDFESAGEFSLYIYDACNNGLMYGSKGRFYPQNSLSRAEAIVAIMRHFAGNMNENQQIRYEEYINYAAQQGFIDNGNLEAMKQKMLRFEALILLWRAAQKA